MSEAIGPKPATTWRIGTACATPYRDHGRGEILSVPGPGGGLHGERPAPGPAGAGRGGDPPRLRDRRGRAAHRRQVPVRPDHLEAAPVHPGQAAPGTPADQAGDPGHHARLPSRLPGAGPGSPRGPVDFRPWPEHGGRGMVDDGEPDHAARSTYPPSSMREEPAPMISVAKVAGADAYGGPARESPVPTDGSASEVGG